MTPLERQLGASSSFYKPVPAGTHNSSPAGWKGGTHTMFTNEHALTVSCECFYSTFIKLPGITTFSCAPSPLLFFLEYMK